ncbi:MAG: hypothetical protein M3Y87_24535 [Myxococcota bacterium]|nr:hypothetical protein [Myxococcota bacterium]
MSAEAQVPAGGALEVLAVDRDPSAVSGLAITLAPLGVLVRGASNARSALDHVALGNTTLVVLGPDLDDMAAIDLARELRTRFRASAPRILWIAPADARRVQMVHVDDLVRRPYRAADLLVRARRLLRPSGVRRLSTAGRESQR